MSWRNKFYREQPNLLGVVRELMGFNPAKFETTSDDEIKHYIRVAQRYRDAYKEEKAKQPGNRSDTDCTNAVRARLQLPQSDYERFYPGSKCDYLTPERVFLLACVAVTGSREGATTLSAIALPRRNSNGLREHINTYLKHSAVPNE